MNWILHQDNAAVHTSNYTKAWIKTSYIDCMDWPAKSLNPNVIEIAWRLLARTVYSNGQQYESETTLQNTILIVVTEFSVWYIQSLKRFMPAHLVSVIEKEEIISSYWPLILISLKIWYCSFACDKILLCFIFSFTVGCVNMIHVVSKRYKWSYNNLEVLLAIRKSTNGMR